MLATKWQYRELGKRHLKKRATQIACLSWKICWLKVLAVALWCLGSLDYLNLSHSLCFIYIWRRVVRGKKVFAKWGSKPLRVAVYIRNNPLQSRLSQCICDIPRYRVSSFLLFLLVTAVDPDCWCIQTILTSRILLFFPKESGQPSASEFILQSLALMEQSTCCDASEMSKCAYIYIPTNIHIKIYIYYLWRGDRASVFTGNILFCS